LRRAPRYLPPLAACFPLEVKKIRELIRTQKIELMIVVGIENPHGGIAARMESIPTIWQINATQTPQIVRKTMTPVVRRLADVIMTTGTKIAKEYPGLVDSLGECWVPFFSPVDVELFMPDEAARARARDELGLSPTGTVIGTVGNRNPQKGHDTFVQAAAILREGRKDVQFVILGARDENHAARDDVILRQAEDLGLVVGQDLLVLDPRGRVSELASAFDIFWFSSVPKSEGVSTAIMEAMALGLPVVATDVGGTSDVVEHDVTGYVVPPLDAPALAAATVALLDSSSLRADMGVAARNRAVRDFRTERCVETHLAAFEMALRRGQDRQEGFAHGIS